jgi:hypothetical protein
MKTLSVLLALLCACVPQMVEKIPKVKVGDLVAGREWVGQIVEITGRCLGYTSTAGTPPQSRSDWVLESEGSRIFVVGPLPRGCDAAGGGSESLTLKGRVLEYTPPVLGNQSAAQRYLELL